MCKISKHNVVLLLNLQLLMMIQLEEDLMKTRPSINTPIWSRNVT